MKKEINCFLSCFLLFISCFCFAQNTDSLWAVYRNINKPDSIRVKAIDDIAWSYVYNNLDSAILIAEKELKFANSFHSGNGRVWASKAYGTMGAAYLQKGNSPKALEFFFKVLKIREELRDTNGVGRCYANIAELYRAQLNFPKALEYDFKALAIFEKIGYKSGIGYSDNNLGLIYFNQSDYVKALEYFEKGLKIMEELGDKREIGNDYTYIGNVYQSQNDFTKALSYYLKSLQLKKSTDDKQGEGICFLSLSQLYSRLSDHKRAILYCDSALNMSKETGNISQERAVYESFSDIYSKTGQYKEAYESHVKFKALTDSIFNAENSRQLDDLKTQFEVEKKETELKTKADAQGIINAIEKKRQQLIIYSVAGVLLIVLVFSLFLYKRFRLTTRQKEIIEEQKKLVDHAFEQLNDKNKEVMDSIYYARRIQRSLITSEKYIEKNLNRLMKK